ncbi:MAG: hypothetical protein ABIJ56_11860 [Pseudomonadota bacterium]
MVKRYAAAAGLSVFFLMSLTTASWATTLLQMSIDKMSAEAAAVVVGEVTDMTSEWSPDQTAIFTTITIKVATCVAGECGDTMLVKQRGGTVGEATFYIPGMPKFSRGQKVLLFLDHSYEGEAGYYSVIGMCQGMFVIDKEKTSGIKFAVQQGGAALAGAGADGVIRVLGSGEQKPMKIPLKKLIKKIQNAIVTLSKAKAKEKK